MVEVEFTELNPSLDENPRVDIYRCDSADIVSDPMTATITVAGFNDSGQVEESHVVIREYPKADWSGVMK